MTRERSFCGLDIDEELPGCDIFMSCLETDNLVDLHAVAENQLHGNLPAEIGRLGRLQILGLASNRFAGPLPHAALGKLTDLRRARLEHNRFSGAVSAAVFADVTNGAGRPAKKTRV